MRERRERSRRLADDGRQEHRPELIVLREFETLPLQIRREVDQIVFGDTCSRIRRRLRWNRLRRRGFFARHCRLRNRTLGYRPHWLTGNPIEHVQIAFFCRQRARLDPTAVYSDVGQQRRRRQVVVPDWMVSDLEVPLPLASLDVDGDQAVTEQIVARTMTAV